MNPLNLNLFLLFGLQKNGRNNFYARKRDDNTFKIFFEDILQYKFCENNQNVLTLQEITLRRCC